MNKRTTAFLASMMMLLASPVPAQQDTWIKDQTQKTACLQLPGTTRTQDCQDKPAFRMELHRVKSDEQPSAGHAIITLKADNIWEEYFGYKQYYQMLLDADADALGQASPWNPAFGFPAIGEAEDAYAMAEYKIPENSSPSFNLPTGLAGDSASLEIPAGTYDIAIILIDTMEDFRWWCYNGYFDNYAIEEGCVYEFHIRMDGSTDLCDLRIQAPDNATASNILSPVSGGDLGEQEVRVQFCNTGRNTIPASTLQLQYRLDGGEPVSETYPQALLPGDTATHAFAQKADLSRYGSHEIEFEIVWDEDYVNADNRLTVTIENMAPVTEFPYTEDFAEASKEWSTLNIGSIVEYWEWDASTGHDAPGSMLSLMPANGDADDWLISPPLQLKAGEANLSFWYQASSTSYPATFQVWFGNSMDISNMEMLHEQSNLNTEWNICPVNAEVPEDGVYFFAIRNTTKRDNCNLTIDDVTIDTGRFIGIPDIQIEHVNLPISACGMGEGIVNVQVSNNGTEAIESFTLEYRVDNQSPVSQQFGSLGIGQQQIVSFETLADFSSIGRHTVIVSAKVDAGTEENTADNADTASLTHFEPASLPYASDMAAGEWNGDVPQSWRLTNSGMELRDRDGRLVSRCIHLDTGTFRFSYTVTTLWIVPSSWEVRMGESGTDPETWDSIGSVEETFSVRPTETSHEIRFANKIPGDYCFTFIAKSSNPLVIKQVGIEDVLERDIRLNQLTSNLPRILPRTQTSGEVSVLASISNRGQADETAVRLAAYAGDSLLSAMDSIPVKAAQDTVLVFGFKLPVFPLGDTAIHIVSSVPEETNTGDNTQRLAFQVSDSLFAFDNENTVHLGEEEGLVSQTANNLGLVYSFFQPDTLTAVTLGLAKRTDMEFGLAVYRMAGDTAKDKLFEKVLSRGEGGRYVRFPVNPIVLSPGEYFIEVQQLGNDPIQVACDYSAGGYFLSRLNTGVLTSIDDLGFAAVRCETGQAVLIPKDACLYNAVLQKTEGVFSSNEPIRVSVGNFGSDTLRNQTVVCTVDKESYTVEIPVLPANSVKEIEFQVNLSAAGIRRITLEIPLDGDADPSDNSLSLQVESWPPANPYEMDFEYCEDFAISDFTPAWTTIDGDNAATYAWNEAEFLHRGERFAYIAFNPSRTEPILWMEDDPGFNAQIAPWDGNRFGVSFQSSAAENDDWLISPKLKIGQDAEFVFHVKSLMEGYGIAQYQAWVSETGTDKEDFMPLCGRSSAPADAWEEIRLSLAEYAGKEVHVAVQCVSTQALLFMLDGLKVTEPSAIESRDALNLCLSLYPNPAREQICIRASEGTEITGVEIFSLGGMKLFQSASMNAEWFSYNTSHLPQGVYLTRVHTNHGSQTLKFVVM